MVTRKRIQILRREKGLIQNELAKFLSVTRPILSNWETGKTLPDAGSLIKLAEYFDVSTDYLLGLSDVRKVSYRIEDFLDELSSEDKASVINFIEYLKSKTPH